MRIVNGNGTSQIGKAKSNGGARSSSANFSVPQQSENASQSAKTSHSSALQDVSTLLALQGVDDALHGKRRKAVRKGNKMLDLLEDVKMGMLSGRLPVAVLQQLERLADELEESGDERIDALLGEIGLRAQVEIAKLEVRRAG